MGEALDTLIARLLEAEREEAFKEGIRLGYYEECGVNGEGEQMYRLTALGVEQAKKYIARIAS